jgi:putative membrane protein
MSFMDKSQPIPIIQTWPKERLALAILLILYAVGIVGVTLPIHPDFMLLTPFNLLTTFAVCLWCQKDWNRGLVVALLLCYLAGMLVEIVGTQTGILFGEYAYGATLGPKLFATPLTMGINWAILVYAVVSMTNRWLGKGKIVLKSILGATLMVLSDLIIEPTAVHFDFWSWGLEPTNALIVAPVQNYLMWWLAALPLNIAFHYLAPQTENKLIEFLFWIQCFFFAWIFIFVI